MKRPGPLDHLFRPAPEPRPEPLYETPQEHAFAEQFNKGLRAARGRTSTVSNPQPASHKAVNEIIRSERSIKQITVTPGEVLSGYAPPEMQQAQATAQETQAQAQAKLHALRRIWFGEK